MSSPTSLKMSHPLYIHESFRRRRFIFYILHMWFSLIPSVFLEVGFAWLWKKIPLIWISIILVPLDILILYYLSILSAIGIMRFRLFFLKVLHTPREGIFPRKITNRDFKFYCLRNYARLFPSYLISSTPFPWFRRTLYFLAFGVRMEKYGINWDVWITPEFVDIGKNVIIGHSSTILSSLLEEDKLIIKTIYIDNNVIVGAKSTLLPGTHMKENSILSAGSYTLPFQELEANGVYHGNPAKYQKSRDDIDFSIDAV